MNASFLVVGVKGGTGATTLCVDLARAARRAKKAVTLVDADLTGGRHIAELTDGIRALNTARGASIFSVARVGDIDVVELVDKYDDSFALRRADLEALANDVMVQGDLVFVDAPRPFEVNVNPFATRATRVLLVMEPDHLGSASARTMVRDLTRFGVPMSQIWLVVNDRQGRPEIATSELQRLLSLEVVADLPRKGDRRRDRALDALVRKMLDAPPESPFSALSVGAAASGLASNGSNGHVNGSNGHTRLAPQDPVARESLDRRNTIRREISDQMVGRIDLVAASRGHSDGEKIAQLRATIDSILDEVIESRPDVGEISLADRAEIKQEIIDEQLGLGPLEELMRDPAVSEIMVNGAKHIYVERNGKLTLSDRVFNDERHLRLVIERIVAPLGRRIDESSPMVDARLLDGSRVNAIIEPLSLRGSSVTIRRFGTKRLTIEDLVRFGSVPKEAVGFLRAMVQAKLNVVVSGGTGTGKTTFLNILSNFIPETDRIVTIEDAAELLLNQEHVVSLEARPPNIEGRGAISIRDLVKNSLRMRPDRIVIGECRGGEALDMLQAMNTGHDGSLTTLHANTARDSIARLETLVLMAGFDLPVRAIREQIAGAVDVIVQIERMRDGSRKCSSITEVVGMEGDVITLQDVIKYQATGVDEAGKVTGNFVYTGVQPHYMDRFEENGVFFDVRELTALRSPEVVW
jgi:pilus assembly protein CpaF